MSFDLRFGDSLSPSGLPSLADNAVDVTITDPPFDARTHAGAGRGVVPFASLSSYELRETARELARVTKRWILIFAAERSAEAWAEALEVAGARFVRHGVAVRTNPMPQMSGDRPAPGVDQIVIAYGSPGRMHWNGGGKAARWSSPPSRFDNPGKKLAHPTQKPLELMRSLVEDFSMPGELIGDPFAGSGTTAVAALELGRRFVGWERDAGYHTTALARVEATSIAPGVLDLSHATASA